MSPFTCSFCTHPNPDGSKFCNECGSPLNLVPCAQCEAINNLTDTHCVRCGSPLAVATIEDAPIAEASTGRGVDETAEPATPGARATSVGPRVAMLPRDGMMDLPEVALVATGDAAEAASSSPTAELSQPSQTPEGESVFNALADRLETLPWELRATPADAETTDDTVPAPVVALAADPHERAVTTPQTAAPMSRGYGSQAAGRARALFFAIAIAAIAGVAYWASNRPDSTGDRPASSSESTASATPATAAAPSTAPSPASDGAVAGRDTTTSAAVDVQPGAASGSLERVAREPLATEPAAPGPGAPSAAAPGPVAPGPVAPDAVAREPMPPAGAAAGGAAASNAAGAAATDTPPGPAPRASTRADKTRPAASTAARSSARSSGESARPAASRAKSQAERDAEATQRLVERELGTAPRPASQ